MNKNFYRIIFNKRRGQLMVAAETSSSQGKGSMGEAVTSGHPAISNFATVAISTLSFAALCALGVVLWALPTPKSHAQVVAYRNSPGNQQPTILQTANGVPQINIQTPSAAGVSHNVYSQFDVQSNGAILNNSRTNVATQLGGWVQGNPWLAKGSARVILNEVNSSNPSYLNGYVEVGGQKAEVVIANPSGISVNGGGFINTSKATLTTGAPIFNGGSLDGYRVQGGNVSINGNGLDLSTTDFAAILARAVKVNAGIWANELKMVTGANQIDATSLGANAMPVTTTIAGTGEAPNFALDVAQIGGMYAGKIHLIGTEQGLGVRSEGILSAKGGSAGGATSGDLVLQNNGWLTTTGALQASANLQINTQGNITNSGTLYANNDQTLSATDSITNSGVIAAQGNTRITAHRLSSTSASVLGSGIKPNGTLANSGNLNIATTQALASHGQNLAAGNTTLTGSSVDLSGSQTGAANITVVANSGNVSTANATVATSGMAGVLAITAKTNNDQTLDNTHGVLSAGQLNLDVANLTNVQGQITQTGVGDTSIVLTSPTSTFNNTGGTVAVNSTNFEITASHITNTDGKIQHAGSGTLAMSADALTNIRGQIVSNQNASLQLASLDNTAGSVYAGNNLEITATGEITNTGFIAAQGNTTLSANRLSSGSTSVLGAGIKADGTRANSGDLIITTTQTLSANGQNLAAGSAVFSGTGVNLSGSQTGGANIDITATLGDVNTSNATVAAAGTLSISAKVNNSQTLNNNLGVLSAGQLNVDVANFNNTQGLALQTGTGDMSIVLTSPTGKFNNTNGTIATNSANLNLSADVLTNIDGKIQHAGTDTLHITANTLNGQRGQIVSNTALVIDAGAVDHRAASAAAKSITLTASSLNNTRGDIVQTGHGVMAVSVTHELDNTAGTLGSNGNLNLAAELLTNNQGQFSALGDLTVTLNTITGALSNLQGLVAAKGNATISAASVDNSLGTLASVDKNLSVTTTGATTNDSGQIQAALDVTLTNAGLSNTRTTNALATSNSPYGSIIGRNVDINTDTQTLNNAGGTIAASQDANLQTGVLNNNGGLIQTGSNLVINTHGQTLTNTHAANYTSRNTALNGKGGIAAQGTTTLTTGDLSNDAGYVGSKGALTANSIGTINNTGGLILSEATTSLSAGTVTNSNTSSTGLGIEGLDVSVSTTTLRNDSGAIRADGQLTITSAGTVDNNAGLLSSANTLTLQDTQAQASRTLAITNTSGTLLAGQSLVVDANSIGGDSRILSKGNLDLSLNADFANSGQVIANGNATITTSGNVNNSGKLQAGNTLNLTANNIDNTVTGDISANTTQINASGTLTNRGLIDGVDTQVNANTVTNIGTGRIYGDHLSIAALNLTNDTETLAGVTQAGTLAARDRLDLGIRGTLTNREHALIYSVGDMAIGGALDATRHATGLATTVNNNSATIEAGGNLSLSATVLHNKDMHLQTALEIKSTSSVVEYQGSGAAKRYAPGDTDVYTFTDESLHLHTPEGIYESWTQYDVTRTISETTVKTSDPSKILAGGRISLYGDTVLNDNSQIIAGGALNASVVDLTNTELIGKHVVHDSGTATSYWRNRRKGTDSTGSSSAAYDPADVTTDLDVSAMRYQQFTLPVGTGTQVASLANSSVTEVLVNASPANARSGSLLPSNVSAPQMTAVSVETTHGASGPLSVAAINAASQTFLVRAALVNTTLPNSSLYKTNPSTTARYLVETDTRFTNNKVWLSSDYMTQTLSLDPTVTQKRLGDGFYEQKLIREQVAELTGRRFLADYTSDEQEYKALMTNAITFAQQCNLRPGIALSAQQVAQLTSDIVWLVEKTVQLPGGSTQKVLVPQLYVKVQPGDLDESGSLLAGKDVNLNLSGDLTNSGTIAGRNVVNLTAENVNNLGGRIGGNDVSVAAQKDLNNIGGTISAVSSLAATAGRDLNIQTTTQSASNAQSSLTGINRVAGLYVSGANGLLLASAGRDLNLTAAVVSNAGTGTTALSAVNNLKLSTVKTEQSHTIVWDANNRRSDSQPADVGSQISGGGAVNLNAGQTLSATAANVQATGALGMNAKDITIQAGLATQNVDEAHQHTSKGFMSKSTVTTRDTSSSTTAQASNFGGATVDIHAGNDIALKGANVVADRDVTLAAGRNVSIEAATNTSQQSNYRQETKSGLMSGGGIGVSYGKQKQSVDAKDTTTTAAASTVGSVGGNVSITAAEQYKQVGSDVLAPGGDITIQAKKVDIVEARETNKQNTEQKFEQSGVTLALNSTVVSTVQNAQNQIKATTQTSDSRMKTLGAASAAANVKMAADALKAGQGDASAADKAGGISVSLSYGTSSSQSNSSATSDTARGSTVKAGGTTTIQATGGGQNSNLTVQGSDISGQQVALAADHEVAFLAASNTRTQTSSNNNSSASVGVAAQLGNAGSAAGGGMGFTGSVSQGKGSGNGTETTYTNTHIKGTDRVTIQSGGDTTLKGATVEGKQITTNVGGNLNIESLQDTATYAEKNQQAGASVMIGAGVTGNVNFAKSNIDSSYASVTEQSGIKAGDGGFTVNVQGNTDLKGGAITSTQAAIDQNKNTFSTGGTLTTSDIQNKANYNASSVGVSVGVGNTPLPGQGLSSTLTGAGLGKDSGSVSSTTTAGISGIAGDTAKRTGDNAQGIGKIFDADKVRQEIQAQTKITQEFAKQASTAVASYTETQRKVLQEQAKQLEKTGTPEGIAQAQQAIKELNMQEKVLNILVGAVTGLGGTAVTKESLAAAADEMRALMIEDSRRFAGVVDKDGKLLFSNISGESVGVNGSGEKIAGSRANLDLLCGADNTRCEFPKKLDGSIDKDKPLKFTGNYEDFLKSDDGKKMLSAPFGGLQGGERTLFGEAYAKGSWQDKLLEAFAGPHDLIGGKVSGLYDTQGNIKQGLSKTESTAYDVWSGAALLPAAPFAIAQSLPPEIWNAIVIFLKAVK